jgi:hypothetical protein
VAERKNMTLIEFARTMLDEYKTSDHFWVEAINTACHAANRLYLHRLSKKTPYELLTDNKHNVSYFRIFGSKCYVLLKRSKSSKFAPKVYKGFMLGYDSNSRAYHVFNKDFGCVKTTCDVVFDETNDSQVEQYDLNDVDDEEAPCDALRNMSIGDVRPQETNEDQPSSNQAALLPKIMMINIKKVKKMKIMIKIMIWAMIKGELSKMKIKMINTSQDHRHSLIQELGKLFNVTNQSTTSLVP